MRSVGSPSSPQSRRIGRVRQVGPRQLLFTTQEVGEATPAIHEALNERGIEVVSSREYRPNFDEVFAELVRSHRAGRAEEEAAAQAGGDGRGGPPAAQPRTPASEPPVAAR